MAELPKLGNEKTTFKVKDKVFCLGFVKAHQGKYFVCKGVVADVVDKGTYKSYKVKITAIADSYVGGKFVLEQTMLLNRIITKRAAELTKHLNPFMAPKNWIEILSHT